MNGMFEFSTKTLSVKSTRPARSLGSSCGHSLHSLLINTLSSAERPFCLRPCWFVTSGIHACVWFMEVWLGVIGLPGEPANTSTSSSPKLWIITVSICQHQHVSAPQEERLPTATWTAGITLPTPPGLQLYLLFNLAIGNTFEKRQ